MESQFYNICPFCKEESEEHIVLNEVHEETDRKLFPDAHRVFSAKACFSCGKVFLDFERWMSNIEWDDD